MIYVFTSTNNSRTLKKVLGKAFLNYTEMMTVLTDIEAITTLCPLTYVDDDMGD